MSDEIEAFGKLLEECLDLYDEALKKTQEKVEAFHKELCMSPPEWREECMRAFMKTFLIAFQEELRNRAEEERINATRAN